MDPFSAVAGAIGGVANVAATIVGAIHEGKQSRLQRAHQLKMSKLEAEQMEDELRQERAIAEQEAREAEAKAETAAALAASRSKSATNQAYIAGGVVLILGIAGLVLLAPNTAKAA